jgi:phosphoglycolate phosphatase
MSAPVFFDLDGTLSDPKVGIVRSIRHALECLGLECPADDELTWCIGPPLLESFARIVGSALAPKALEHYRDRFAELGWRENELYPGIVELLEILAESGRPLYVATSKPLVFANRILWHFRLDGYFSAVFGSGLDGTRSRKDELLRFALAETGATSQAIMVGDREHDIFGARANQMHSIGVTYGYGSREELQSAGADTLVDSPAMLLSVLA